MKILQKLFNSFKQILKLQDSPQSIARGFALGSFIGMMPIPGFQMIVSLSIASLLRINKKAACLAVFNTNLATGAFVFSFNYWLGKKLLGIECDLQLPDELSFGYVHFIFNAGADVFISLTVGGIITGLFAAYISHSITIRYLRTNIKTSE